MMNSISNYLFCILLFQTLITVSTRVNQVIWTFNYISNDKIEVTVGLSLEYEFQTLQSLKAGDEIEQQLGCRFEKPWR